MREAKEATIPMSRNINEKGTHAQKLKKKREKEAATKMIQKNTLWRFEPRHQAPAILQRLVLPSISAPKRSSCKK